MKPVDRPTTTPHSRISCQEFCIAGLNATAAPVAARAKVIVRRTPKRSITAAANGPISP